MLRYAGGPAAHAMRVSGVRIAAPMLLSRSVVSRDQHQTLKSQWRGFQSGRANSSASSSWMDSLSSETTSTLRTLVARLPPGLQGVLLAKGPSGFKNFFPEEGGDSKGTESSSGGDEDGPKKEKKQRPSSKKKKDGEGDGNQLSDHIGKIGIVLALLVPFLLRDNGPAGKEITYQEFKTQYLEGGQVEQLIVANKKRVDVIVKGKKETTAYFYIGGVESFERQLEDCQFELSTHPRNFIPVKYVNELNLGAMLWDNIPTMLTMAFVGFMLYQAAKGAGAAMGGGGAGGKSIFSTGKSTHKVVKADETTNVTFDDVAGMDEAKVEIMEFVKFLQNPDRFTKLGAKIPKGALLVGPPGTGKTLLAKATAGEANVPFYSISGSDFIEMFVGVGPSRVRDLFKEAREDAPCIIFIDEIDAVGRARSKGGQGGGNDERENTLNQMLVEMDGFNTTEGVVVLAGTNRADVLDKALLRPGRFDRQIQVSLPDIKGRASIFKVHLKNIKLGHDLEDVANRMSALTPGMSGADIANVCNEAALIAARHKKKEVQLVDFEAACDRVIGGLEKKNHVMNAAEKKLVAYHEAGHAVVGWFLEHADPLLKVTIVPRGNGALGFAQYLPKELSLYQTEQLTDMMCMALGGRAAEQAFFGKISTGASDDLKRVTKIAYGQVTMYGMNANIGHLNFSPGANEQQFVKPYSEHTAEKIDHEVSAMIAEAYERTLGLVDKYKDKVEALAQKLLEVETVNHDIITDILGPRPHVNDAYRDYMEAQKVIRVQREELAAKAKEGTKEKAAAESKALDDKIKAAEEAIKNGNEAAEKEGDAEVEMAAEEGGPTKADEKAPKAAKEGDDKESKGKTEK